MPKSHTTQSQALQIWPLQILPLLAFALLVLMFAEQVQAQLRWTGENIADEKTIALYHFNEGSGTVANNEVQLAPGDDMFVLSGSDLWKTNPSWLETPSGAYLDNNNGSGGALYDSRIGQTAGQVPIDWGSVPGVTISFWMQDALALPNENQVLDIGFNDFRDQQARFGYRPGFSNSGRLRMEGEDSPFSSWYNLEWADVLHDGDWHHVALVWDSSTSLSSLYIDNTLVEVGADADGAVTQWGLPEDTFTDVVSEFWNIGEGQSGNGFGGAIDELLIQGEVLTNFSDALGIADQTPPTDPGPTLPPTEFGELLYQADFSSDTSSEWDLTELDFEVGAGLASAGPWINTEQFGFPTGTEAIDAEDVQIEATIGPFGQGNPNSYAELAARAQSNDDGVALRVQARDNNAEFSLLDNGVVLENVVVPGLRTAWADLELSLTVEGDQVTATLFQAAGSADGGSRGTISWSDVGFELTGTVSSTGSGNVRYEARSATDGTTLTDFAVFGPSATRPIPEPGTLTLLAAGGLGLILSRRKP